MGKKGLLLCVCQGTCPSFHDMDIFEVGNAVRREHRVDYIAIHPQLCSSDGEVFLTTLLHDPGTENLYVGGCAPRMQVKMFRDSFAAAHFDEANLHGIDIRNLSTEAAVQAIQLTLADNSET